ncbi:hypothetical protein [Tardiphaga sp.]|jgi:hypothetical protein|uniref:hypothetical protein n=1 Tax=Tardiphaga sp. TaxID=1926292 RepID=UPI0037DA0AD0
MIRLPLTPFSAVQGQPAVQPLPGMLLPHQAECGGENHFTLLSSRADRSRVFGWVVACVALGLAFNAAHIAAVMWAASPIGN